MQQGKSADMAGAAPAATLLPQQQQQQQQQPNLDAAAMLARTKERLQPSPHAAAAVSSPGTAAAPAAPSFPAHPATISRSTSSSGGGGGVVIMGGGGMGGFGVGGSHSALSSPVPRDAGAVGPGSCSPAMATAAAAAAMMGSTHPCSMSLSESAVQDMVDSLAEHWGGMVASVTATASAAAADSTVPAACTSSGTSAATASPGRGRSGSLREGDLHGGREGGGEVAAGMDDGRDQHEEEEEEEQTGISLLDATAAAQVKLAMKEHVADASSYQAALRLLDKKDPKSEITSVPKAMKILQVSAGLRFDEGINACLRYLEAVPWTAEEEKEVVSALAKLGLDHTKAGLRVLARLAPSSTEAVHSVLKKLLAQAVAPPSEELGYNAECTAGTAPATGAAASGCSRGSSSSSSGNSTNVASAGGVGGGSASLSSSSPPSPMCAISPAMLSDATSKKMWRGSVEKLFGGSKLKLDVRKRVLFEQLDQLIDRVQACVVEDAPDGSARFVDMSAAAVAAQPDARLAAARFAVEMDNLAWLMGAMVDRLGFAEYIVKWLSEDAAFVRNVDYYSHRRDDTECAMYDPLLPIVLRLLSLMVGGHILIPTATRFALLKLWLPVLSTVPRLPAVLSRERGRLLGELLGQLVVTLPQAQQEEVLDVWLTRCGGCYNTWLDMGPFLERWLERSSKKMR